MKLDTDTAKGASQLRIVGAAETSTGPKPPPNYFSRREQVRLLTLCTALMIVLGAMNEARKPSTWHWMWQMSSQTDATPGARATAGVDADANLNASAADTAASLATAMTKVPEPAHRNLPPDGFVALKAEPASSDDDDADTPDTRFVTGIDAALLAPIEDNTVLRVAENEAWLTMLQILQSMSPAEIQASSVGSVGLLQLMRQTDVYRGQLVKVTGTLRRLEPLKARENDRGIEQLYRWIIQPAGSNLAPFIVYSLEKPDHIQPQDDLYQSCEVTGFCFKRWVYPAADGSRVGVLLLAKCPQVAAPRVKPAADLPSGRELALAALACVALAVLIAGGVWYSTVRQRPEVQRMRPQQASTVDVTGDVLPSPGESLAQLARQELDEQSAMATDGHDVHTAEFTSGDTHDAE